MLPSKPKYLSLLFPNIFAVDHSWLLPSYILLEISVHENSDAKKIVSFGLVEAARVLSKNNLLLLKFRHLTGESVLFFIKKLTWMTLSWSISDSPGNSGCPSDNSPIMQPMDQTSTALPYLSPNKSSGALYHLVATYS